MVVSTTTNPSTSNVTGDLECTGGLRLNNQRQKLRQRFDIVRKLGQGTYGKVQLALNKDSGEEVAIKTIKKAKIETEQDLIRIQREIQIMSSVQHPHIIHIYEVFENKEKIVLVMEYASGGELYDYLSFKKTLNEGEARRLFRQVASAVYYCHKNKICHRDLKLENILLDEKGNAKIADFGLSNVFDEKRRLDTFCGSPLYASPEIVKGTPYYGPEVDCWSLGVLLYTLVYGAMPFDGSNFRRLVKQISEGDYYEPKKPSEASGLIRHLLTVVPSGRATIEEVCNDWWVNLGYDDPLILVAEELGKATPVRLDYLLELAAPTNEEEGKEQSGNKKEKLEHSKILAEEKPSAKADGKDIEMQSDAGTDGKKHQLTASDRSIVTSSTDTIGVKRKKKQKTEEKIDVCSSEVPVENEKPMTVEGKLKSCISSADGDGKDLSASDNLSQTESVPCTPEPMPLTPEPALTPEPTAVEENGKRSEKSLQGEMAGEIVKAAVITASEKPTTPLKASLSSTETRMDMDFSVTLKAPKKDTAETGKNEPKPKLRSQSLKTTTIDRVNSPTSINKEKKSLVFPALKVSDAKRTFEAKPQEKRSVVIPGLKVSAARKAFEASTSTPSPASARRASMPKMKIGEVSSQSKTAKLPESNETTTSTPASESTRSDSNNDEALQKKTAGFLPTLDVTMAVKPKKSSAKPPPVPRLDTSGTSTTSGTSSGENTPDASPRGPPQLPKAPFATRRASYPKAQTTQSASSLQEVEMKTMTETDSLSLNALSTTADSSLQSSTSTLTGGDSTEFTWGSVASIESKDHRESCRPEGGESTTPTLTEAEPSATKMKKKNSMEIKLNSGNETVEPASSQPVSTMAEPQLVLRQPPGGGKFTLLGVTSEVTFDVAAVPSDEEEEVQVKTLPRPQQNNSLFMSVTLPPPPPPSDSPTGSPDLDPEQKSINSEATAVTNTRRSREENNRKKAEKSGLEKQKQFNRCSSYERESGGTGKEKYFREVSKDSEEMTSSHQGYSVYRSKFRSLQKAFLGDESAPRQREPSLERSESFSSTGSTDDLEDMFENFTTGNSLLSNILGRTRSIIEEFARDDVATAARRHAYSSFFRRPSNLASRRTSDLFSKLESSRPYTDTASTTSSGIGSSRSSRASRQPPSEPESSQSSTRPQWHSGSRSRTTTESSTASRDLGPDIESYFSDSGSRRRSSHGGWFSRSTSREEDASETRATSRSMFSSFSHAASSNVSEDARMKDSARNAATSNSQYSASRCDSSSTASSLASSQKRSSLSSRYRAGSTSKDGDSPAWDRGYSNQQSWSETSRDENQQQQQYSSLSRSRKSSASETEEQKSKRGGGDGEGPSEVANDATSFRRESSVPSSYPWSPGNYQSADTTSVYGTMRRPRMRYGKSTSNDLPDVGRKPDDESEGDKTRARRPRSLLVLSDSNDDGNDWDVRRRQSGGEGGTSAQQKHTYRSSCSFERLGSPSSIVDGMPNSTDDVKKKSEQLSDSRSVPPQHPQSRPSRFGFRRTPSQERTFESGSGTGSRVTNQMDQTQSWRGGSHGRELPPSYGSNLSSNNGFHMRSKTEEHRSELVRRTSLNERGRFSSDNDKSTTPPLGIGGAAGYWAKRYGTTSRVPPAQRRASATGEESKIESEKPKVATSRSGESLNKCAEESPRMFMPRRRSTAGIEGNSEPMDVGERTRGLLRYARSISHELDQLHSDLCARFGFRQNKKTTSPPVTNPSDATVERAQSTECQREKINRGKGSVLEEMKKFEADLLKPKVEDRDKGNGQDLKKEQVDNKYSTAIKQQKSPPQETPLLPPPQPAPPPSLGPSQITLPHQVPTSQTVPPPRTVPSLQTVPSPRTVPPPQSVSPPSQTVSPPSQTVPPPSQAVPPPSQAVPPPSQAVQSPSQTVPPPSQTVPPSSQTVPPSQTAPPFETVLPPQTALPTQTVPSSQPAPASFPSVKQINELPEHLRRDDDGNSSGTATPTDMDDSCSMCSEYECRSGGSGFDESVSERIRRKSYFARFQDRRKHHHQQNSTSVPPTPAPSYRSNVDLNGTKPFVNHCHHRTNSPTTMTNHSEGPEDDGRYSTFSRKSISRLKDAGIEDKPSYYSTAAWAAKINSQLRRNNVLHADGPSDKQSVSPEDGNRSISPNSTINDPDDPDREDDRETIVSSPRPLSRACSVAPEMMEPSSGGYSASALKSLLRQRSACDSSLRPSSPMSRRISMMEGSSTSPAANGDAQSSYHHYPSSGWSTYERRKSRPLTSILSSLPLEATVQSRAKLRSRHDYLINRALSTLEERYTRPISPSSRRMSSTFGLHDNHAAIYPSSDLRRYSAILDSSSPRDVIRKALDVCNSLQY